MAQLTRSSSQQRAVVLSLVKTESRLPSDGHGSTLGEKRRPGAIDLVPPDMKFASYKNYLAELETLVAQGQSLELPKVEAALNGEPSRKLKELVDLKVLRRTGTFFTSQKVALSSLKAAASHVRCAARIVDPACGVGDLLIACARLLPLFTSLRATLEAWSKRLAGNDICDAFVRIARLRLLLLAASRGNWKIPESVIRHDYFGGLRAGDLFSRDFNLQSEDLVVLNPPFIYMQAGEGCTWSSGRVSAAAVFVEHLLCKASSGQCLCAILPDVLRTGTRYARWRKQIATAAEIENLRVIGRFDPSVDVDVFSLMLVKKNVASVGGNSWTKTRRSSERSVVGDFFEVSIGPVVPHRHKRGHWHPFVHAKTAPVWTAVKDVPQRRRFNGRLASPPFVVVRRTSNSCDKYRASASIVNTDYSVAVENHLIVLRPRDGRLATCKAALSVLKDPRTTRWLNNRIRCRHLTTSALKSVPWWA